MSERTVYAIASGKGGVGKTTTAINLGAMLADRGHEVVVVDTDLGMANLADFLDFEIEKPTLHEVLAGDADFEAAIYRAPGDIDVLPSGVDIEAFAKSDPTNLQHVVGDLREEYDYVLLDTGAGVSYDTLVPLALADGVLLVATPDVASVRDTAKTGELADRVESEVRGAVLTQRSSDILNADDVEETLRTDVLAVVPQDEAVPMGIDAGRPLAAFAPNAPAGQAYRELAAVVTGEVDPDPELDLDGTGGESSEENASEETTEVSPDDFAAPELAENVREAAEKGDQSGGLLGGELATAADEIRKQAGESHGADRERRTEAGGETADAPGAKSTPASTPGSGSDTTAGEGAETADVGERAETADASEEAETADASGGTETADANDETGGDARSVEDLINEHISDERLGGRGTDSEEGDPLAQMSEELTDESDSASAKGESGDGGTMDFDTDDEAWDESDDRGESDDWSEGEESNQASRDDEDEPRDDAESSSGEVPFEDGDHETGTERETELGRDAETAIEEPFDPDESDDAEKENGGLFGRIGSLFK